MKRIVFWDYERGTWQYDVACLLIIAFIFLSPQGWFETGKKKANLQPKVAVITVDNTLPVRRSSHLLKGIS